MRLRSYIFLPAGKKKKRIKRARSGAKEFNLTIYCLFYSEVDVKRRGGRLPVSNLESVL